MSADRMRAIHRASTVVVAMALSLAMVGCDSTTGDGENDTSRATSPGHCDGAIGSDAVDDVRVPDGATCTLDGTTVDGNVSVGRQAVLIAHGVSIDGDVEGEGADSVEIAEDSSIGGNLQLEKGGASSVTDTHIDGDLEWSEQSGALTIEHSSIGGNLQADGNSGEVTVSDTSIGGDLSCDGNSATPGGGGNDVAGNRAGQCSGL
jgi:hypothetical protein